MSQLIFYILYLHVSSQCRAAFCEIQGSVYNLKLGPNGKYIGTLELLLEVVTNGP